MPSALFANSPAVRPCRKQACIFMRTTVSIPRASLIPHLHRSIDLPQVLILGALGINTLSGLFTAIAPLGDADFRQQYLG